MGSRADLASSGDGLRIGVLVSPSTIGLYIDGIEVEQVFLEDAAVVSWVCLSSI